MLRDIDNARVDDIEAELCRESEPAGIDLAHEDVRACLPRDECDEQPDGAAADDDRHLVGTELGSPDVVACDREGLGQCGGLQVDPRRQPMKRERRHGPGALECAWCIDPEELEVPADMAEALVGRCLASRVEWPHDDGVADLEAVHARPELGHCSRHLVPDHLRCADTVIHSAVRDVQVRPADPAVRDLEPHLAVDRGAGLRVAKREAAAAVVVDGLHGPWPFPPSGDA